MRRTLLAAALAISAAITLSGCAAYVEPAPVVYRPYYYDSYYGGPYYGTSVVYVGGGYYRGGYGGRRWAVTPRSHPSGRTVRSWPGRSRPAGRGS